VIFWLVLALIAWTIVLIRLWRVRRPSKAAEGFGFWGYWVLGAAVTSTSFTIAGGLSGDQGTFVDVAVIAWPAFAALGAVRYWTSIRRSLIAYWAIALSIGALLGRWYPDVGAVLLTVLIFVGIPIVGVAAFHHFRRRRQSKLDMESNKSSEFDQANSHDRDRATSPASDTEKVTQLSSPEGEGRHLGVPSLREAPLVAGAGVGGVPSVPLLPLLSRDPQQLGVFRLLGRLGSGGMGTAFLGQGPSGWVVVKEAHASAGSDPVMRARLQREVAAMRQAAGPFTAAVVDADVDGEVPWVAMEFVPGETLARTVTASGPLSDAEVESLALGLARGLVFLHGRGVVHRDLKPSNIMLSPSGPRVIDLGIAEVDEGTQLTRTGSIVGSTGWLAPEQVRGDGVGAATDVHAWALCVIYAATGVPPFGADTSAAAIYRVLETTPDVPASLAPPLHQLVSQALNKDPDLRPNAQTIADHLGGLDATAFASKQ
jgi:serine/threonine protein kinase